MNRLLLLCLLPIIVTGAAERNSFAKEKDKGNRDTAQIQGCLQRSDGSYILVDKNNEFERLSNNSKLKNLVGHEVKLTGKPQIRTIDTTPAGGASSAKEQRYFQVTSVEDVTPNCQAYGR